MLRRARVFMARIGVFPIQLDPPTLGHAEMINSVIRSFNLEGIILLPYTKFAVTIPHSLHLAALAGVAATTMNNVTVDLSALEEPNARLPRVAQLLRQHGADSVLVHWHHDRSKIQSYDEADQISAHETLLLRMNDMKDEEEETGAIQCEIQSRTCSVNIRRGSETRRLLFEGEIDPRNVVSPAVLKYLNTHHLYRDFRRTKTHALQAQTALTQGHSYDFSPHVCFEGSIPRLEILFDESNKTAASYAATLKDFQCRPGEQPDLIVPIGGDGYMMQSIRRNWNRFIPFFGVNAGHVGYLLNDAAHLEELITSPLKVYHTNMLYVNATHYDEHTGLRRDVSELAFNDAWIERCTGQTALIDVTINGEKRLTRARGDGMLVSTAAGSTAYAIALGASPLPVGASMIQLVGSNICSPGRLKPVHLNQDVVVELQPQDTFKRPCKGYVDGVEVGLIHKMTIRSSRVAGVQLAFSKSCDLQAKLYKLQFPTN